ncbi:MAG: glycosyl hydrolase family protein [Solirubrobacteraceae bacterium]
MRRPSRRSSAILAILASGLAAVTLVASHRSVAHEHRHSVATLTLSVGKPSGRTIPPGFLGLSFEYPAVAAYAGTDPGAVNPVLLQLIRNLSPGQAPILRIGGDTTDWTWWPLPGVAKPLGIKYTLTPRWVRVTGALARDLGARLLLGVNLELDSPRAASVEARALVSGIGRGSIVGLEPGNEPELYGSFSFYLLPGGKAVTGRPAGYDFADYLRDFSQISRSLPEIPLVGPATGAPRWIPELRHFLAAQPRVQVATLHKYPLQTCFIAPALPQYPTIAHFLSPVASKGLAASIAPFVKVAHERHVALRIDEMNSDSCGRAPGISDAFVSALWALDAVFEMARFGVDGVNIHTYPRATYQLFRFTHRDGRWSGFVAPEYYGLEMFAQAAPPGARLLDVSGALGEVRPWATRASDGTVHVVLINEDTARSQAVSVRIPGAHGPATLTRLLGKGISAITGVTLGGQTFGTATTTGTLSGHSNASTVRQSQGGYVVTLPRASAAMLTIPAPPPS